MAEQVRGVNLLQNELQKAKDSLKGVDENIKKLTGRDPTIPNFRPQTQRRVSLGSSDRGEGKPAATESRLFNLARRGIVQDDPGPRRRPGGAFSRLGPRPGGRGRDRRRDSGDEEESRDRPTLQSSVIATPREERSRLNSIEEQSKDRKGQARNRRMFGLLLGTLQKFKDESVESKKKEVQRIEIENKLEEKFKQEKQEIIEERRQLFLDRRRKQFRIKLIEQKMEMAQNHDDWERETRKLENFILTKSKPHIFYMPKILTQDSDAKLKDTKLAVDAMIENRRKKLEEEINEMMSQVHDVEDEDHGDDDDDSMGEGHSDEEHGEETHHGDGKENRDREGREGKESAPREVILNEREQRDKEREQRDRDRRMKDKQREERKEGRKRRESERSKERERGKPKGKSRSRSRSRERHGSSKNKASKRRRHHSGEDGAKSRRKSREEGKAEKKSKVWEPMEDEEEEEEFVGTEGTTEGGGSIQSKMLQMAGMAKMGVGERVGVGRVGGDIETGDDAHSDKDEGAGQGQSVQSENIGLTTYAQGESGTETTDGQNGDSDNVTQKQIQS